MKHSLVLLTFATLAWAQPQIPNPCNANSQYPCTVVTDSSGVVTLVSVPTVTAPVLDPNNGVWSSERIAYGRNRLRDFQASVAKVQGGSGVTSVLLLSDSWGGYGYIDNPLRTGLQTLYGNAGPGYISLDASSIGTPNNPPTGVAVTSAGTWVDLVRDPADIAIHCGQTTSTDTVSGTKTVAATFTDAVIHYAVKQSGGSFTYNIDAGGAVTINTDIAALNMLQHSSDFTNAAWSGTGINLTPAAATAPDGNPATLLADTITTVAHYITQHNAVISGNTYTVSTIAKSNGEQYLIMSAQTSGTAASQFDLIAGTVYAPGGYGAQFVSQSILSLGNGWYRCSLTLTASGSGQLYTSIYLKQQSSYLGTASDQIYAEGLQLNIGPAGAPYVTTPVTATGPLYATWPISGLANSPHSMVLAVTVAGGAGATLFGVDLSVSGTGLKLHRAAMPGSQASQFAAMNAYQWEVGIRSLAPAPNLVMMLWGVNEMYNSVPPATQVAALTTLLNRVSAALPYANILILTPADISAVSSYTMPQYVQAQMNFARQNGAAFLENYSSIGPYADGYARGLYIVGSLIHVNAAGGKLIANNIYNFLTVQN